MSSPRSQTVTTIKNAAKNLGPTLLSMSGPPSSAMISAAVEKIRPQSPQSRPGSSDGSTTVSANSSPGVDQQQEREELTKAIDRNMRMNERSFKTVDDMYPSTIGSGSGMEAIGATAASVAGSGPGTAVAHPATPFIYQQQMSTSSSSNGNDEAAAAAATKAVAPKRKSRKQQQ